MKKVAFFLPHLAGGGAEKLMVTLANEFHGQGFRVDFVLVKAEGVNLKFLSKDIHLVDLHSPNIIDTIWKLRKYFDKKQPDFVISSLDLTNLMALIARRLSNVKPRVFIRVENTVSIQKRSFWKKKLEKILLSNIYPWADRVIAVSQYVADDIKKYAGLDDSRVRVIYNPVITPSLWEKIQEDVQHKWFCTEPCPPVILGVGRLTLQKNFPVLLEAFALVLKKNSAKLVILGNGEERQELQKLACQLGVESEVDFPGYVENPYPFMRRSKVFALVSKWEGLPTVLIEALACGCNVISTDCPGGSREILKDGEYGDLIPVDDVDALAKSIEKHLHMGNVEVDNAWLQQFTLEQSLDQTLRLLGGF